ncbi:hypothetical protein ABT301_05820 [Streptomyces sp. NPDC000987]|uniref:hypothetical protein n=1 Tax=Streptomyces sp. NPDC000987 TaxID=3154374 RepID=UPI003327DF3C
MITHADDGPDFDPDDPLAVLLRPPAGHLGAPPGRYEAIRRGAARRRLLRAAAGAGAVCAVAVLVALPLRSFGPGTPAPPAVPLAPPPVSGPATGPGPSTSPRPAATDPATRRSTVVPTPAPGGTDATDRTGRTGRAGRTGPTDPASRAPSTGATGATDSRKTAPSAPWSRSPVPSSTADSQG